jgi:predicted ester cyclase
MQIARSENASLVQRLVDEVLNQKKTEMAQHLYAPDCCGSTPDGTFLSRSELLSVFDRYEAAFPQFRIDIDYLAADKDRVVLHYTFIGAHTGWYKGLPPAGLTLRIPCVMISRIFCKRIVRQDFLWDSTRPLDSIVGRAA